MNLLTILEIVTELDEPIKNLVTSTNLFVGNICVDQVIESRGVAENESDKVLENLMIQGDRRSLNILP